MRCPTAKRNRIGRHSWVIVRILSRYRLEELEGDVRSAEQDSKLASDGRIREFEGLLAGTREKLAHSEVEVQELTASNKALTTSITQLTDKVGETMRDMQGLRDGKTRADNTCLQLRRQLTDLEFRMASQQQQQRSDPVVLVGDISAIEVVQDAGHADITDMDTPTKEQQH